MIAILSMFSGLCACSEGEYSDLKCDSSFVPECLDTRHLMTCENGVLMVTTCGAGDYCKVTNPSLNPDGTIVPGTVGCAAAADREACISGAKQCVGNVLQTCENGVWGGGVACPGGCSAGACIGCTDGEKRCDGSWVQKCSGGSWLYDESCDQGCESGACKVSKVCEDGAKQCSGAFVQTCEGGEWKTAASACENGCTEGECELSCQEGAVRCDDAYIQTCEGGEWKTAASACEIGCVKGECRTEAVDWCAKNADCEVGTCERGVCVTDLMRGAKSGAECDIDSFVEFCDGEEMVYCTEDDDGNYVVDRVSCSEFGGCSVIDMSEEMETETFYPFVYCKGEQADKCEKEGDKYFECTDDEDYGSYEIVNFCYANTDGDYTVLDGGFWGYYGFCNDGDQCGSDGHCENEIEPYFCEYMYQCSADNKLSYCLETIFGVFSGTDACAEGQVCTSVGGQDGCFSKCETEGEVDEFCAYDEDFEEWDVVVSECVKGDDNNLYMYETYNVCDHGCDEDTVECIKLTDDEGSACEIGMMECRNDDLAAYCSEEAEGGVLKAESCNALSEGSVCRVFDEGIACVSLCDEVDEKTVECVIQEDRAVRYASMCVASEDGTVKYKTAVSGESYYCPSGACEEDGSDCVKVVPEEREACDSETYVEKCGGDDENAVVFCRNKMVSVIVCGEETECAAVENGYGEGLPYADCFSEEDECEESELGKERTVCEDYVSGMLRCAKASNGKNYWYEYDYEECDWSCNDEGTACEDW